MQTFPLLRSSYVPEAPADRLFLPTSEFSSHLVICMYLYNGVQLTSKLHHTGTWSATAWPHRYLCYHPAVLFRHFRLTALSYLQGKIQGASEKCYYLNCFYVFKTASLETCIGQGVSALWFWNLKCRAYLTPGQKTFDSIVNQGSKFSICIYLIASKQFFRALGSARRQFWLSQREPRIFENAHCVFLGRAGIFYRACISRNSQFGPQEFSALQKKKKNFILYLRGEFETSGDERKVSVYLKHWRFLSTFKERKPSHDCGKYLNRISAPLFCVNSLVFGGDWCHLD